LLQTGYDTDEAEDEAPRVRKLTKYGQMWLDAMTKSSMTRRRLLRTRSQGVPRRGMRPSTCFRPAAINRLLLHAGRNGVASPCIRAYSCTSPESVYIGILTRNAHALFL
jgi:hypothetical protein